MTITSRSRIGTRMPYPHHIDAVRWDTCTRQLRRRGLHRHDDGTGYVVAAGAECGASGSVEVCRHLRERSSDEN